MNGEPTRSAIQPDDAGDRDSGDPPAAQTNGASDRAGSASAPVLPSSDAARVRVLLGRAIRRHCPYCGADGIFAGWWSLRDQCPSCGVSFEREEGYFLGAYALNLLVAEVLGLGIALVLIFKTRLSQAPLLWQELVAVSFAVALPLLFFPYSRTTWMALDLLLHPPVAESERRARGHAPRKS